MIVVSDTSPITHLMHLGIPDLLERLFSVVYIPQKVYEELSNYELQKEALKDCNWILICQVADQEAVASLEYFLDAGEAEAIVLAKEKHADILLMDERKGREIAEKSGIRTIGLLGVLIRSKQQGFIEQLKPILDTLVQECGFRVKQDLYERVLKEVQELE